MLSARIELRGEELFCADTAESGASSVKPLSPEALARLRGWAERYDRAVRSSAPEPLVEIGRDIAAFLDDGDRWLDRVLGGTGEIALEIAVPGRPEERERLLLDVPWELLAPNGIFLAADNERLFRVARRLGGTSERGTPAYRDLALLFMAAEVEGQGTLNYEQEEAAILQVTRSLALNLSVEESGAVEFLGERIAGYGPFEALHLSCHGDIINGDPVLLLEKPEGGGDLAGIAALSRALGEEGRKPDLVFLSACRTGEHGAAASPFVQSLVRSGVHNAIGWDGSVNDSDAIAFAQTFYEELARGNSVDYAAARARGALLRVHLAGPPRGRHWHLARVYAGALGGGPLCDMRKSRRAFSGDAGYKEFLDIKLRRVPVATAAEFVGRRRQAQRILRAFRDREHAGVLIHGIGSQGKSSLAARIANRMPGHDTVVVSGRYDALAVFEALRGALPPRLQGDFDRNWRQQVTNDASALQTALLDMLEGPFRAADPATRAKPILLIVDDLEQILETPKPGETATPVKTAYSVALASIIAAFRDADTESRLLVTSRYTFALTDARGDDLAARLVAVQLPPMDETQRDKQMRAAAWLAGAEASSSAGASATRAALESRIKEAAGGNPGLQAILSRPLLASEIEAATRAVAAVEAYRQSGKVPEEASAAAEFFEHVSLTAFKDMLTSQETTQLRAASLFSLPVPRAVLVAAGRAASVPEPERAIDRLQGLGLVDVYLVAGNADEAAVNPLARPLVLALNEAETARFAGAAVTPLYDLWKDAEGALPLDGRGLEAARLALLGNAPPQTVNAAARAGAFFLYNRALDARGALNLVLAALAALDRAGADPDLHLLRHGADCAERVGQTEQQDMLLERGLRIKDADPRARAMLLYASASRHIQTGAIDAAEKLLKEAAEVFNSLGEVRSRALTMGKIADILQARGQLDEALRIRQEEELPVYERLGDVRSRAVTMGQIADFLQARGQLDEALRIRQEEELPVYERLGDVRSRAVTMGKIADILQARGQLDEALKIRTEEELPVYERLGDVRSRAVTMGKIADIHQARGQLDEALRIRQEEQLPVYERLGDVRSRAVTMGKIADILQARGQLDEALKIRTEEELPVYERLGDVRERAVTMGKIADIHQARGQLDEALRIRQEEQLPVYERLGDVRSRALTMGKIADILQARGQLDEALRIRQEEQLPVYERLGDVRSRAVTMGKIADILQARGQLDEALKIRTEEELPVYERLGDVRERAVTMGKIADIHQARGQLDEALKIHNEEELPVYERLGDVEGIANVRFKSASVRLQRGGWKAGEAPTILQELSESFSTVRRTQRAEAVAAVGKLLGPLLAQAGRIDEAVGVLRQAEAAYELLQQGESAAQVRALQDEISGNSPMEADLGSAGRDLGLDAPDRLPPAPLMPSVSVTRDVSGESVETLGPAPAVDNAEYLVWYGTNRRPNDPADAGNGYSGARDNAGVVHYGSCRVFIPESHKIGSTGSPWWKRLLTLTDDRLRLLGISELARDAYWGGVAAHLAAVAAEERNAVVFVHGYNVSFEDAALRAAQIGFDLSIKGAMAFFSWPSQGSTSAYPADEATIEASEGAIADFMTDFADRSGAGAVHIIAHSMGNRGVLRAVNRIAAAAQQRTGKPFGQVILAAADVDADVFRQLSAAYAEVASRTTLYVSKRDLAVEASRWLHAFPRAGLMPPTLVVPGIDTVNVTDVDLTLLGHGYVAEARAVLTDMHTLIVTGAPPDRRFGLRPTTNEEGERFWLIGG